MLLTDIGLILSKRNHVSYQSKEKDFFYLDITSLYHSSHNTYDRENIFNWDNNWYRSFHFFANFSVAIILLIILIGSK